MRIMIWRSRHRTLSQPASAEWRLDWSVSEAPSSTLYRLSNDTKGEGRYVSVTKRALSQERQARFLKTAALFQSRGAPIVTYGFDSVGCGFITWDFSSAKPVLYDNPGVDIRRFRYLSALLWIEVLHEEDLFHGGLTGSGFVVDERNNAFLFDVIHGDELAEEKKVSGELAMHWMPDGEGVQTTLVRDVYAMGVLGLIFFEARFMPRVLADEDVDKGLQSLRKDSPRWVHSVVVPIVSEPKKQRLHNASALLAAIAVDERLHSKGGEEVQHGGGAAEVSLEELAGLMQRGVKRKRSLDIHTFITSKRGIVLSSVLLLFLLIIAGFFRMDLSASSGEVQEARVVATAPPSDPVSLEDLSEVNAFIELQRGDLVPNSERVRALWNRIVKGGNQGANASSLLHELAEYIETIGFTDPEHVAFLAQFADQSISVEDKARNIERYVQDNSDGTGAIVVALAGEAGEARGAYRKALQTVLCSGGCEEFVMRASTDALLLLADHSGVLSESDVERYAEGLPRDEVWLVLERYANKSAKRVSSVVKSLLKHEETNGVSAAYLAPLIQKSFDSRVPQSALIASARKGVSRRELNQFIRWNDEGSVRVLVASLAAKEAEVVSLALSALASKPIEDPLLYSLIQLARSANGDDRAGYVSLVMAVGLNSTLSVEERKDLVLQASKVLASDRRAITAILRSGSDEILQIVLQEHGALLHPSVLLQMLDSGSVLLRKQVLPLLQEVRVQSVRQAVLKRYFEEKDDSVRTLYEELGLLE